MAGSFTIQTNSPTRSFTITQQGEARSFQIATGVGPSGITQITSTTAPTDTSVIWIDPESGIQSIYSGGGWVTQLTSSGIPNGALTFQGNLLTFQGNQITFTS